MNKNTVKINDMDIDVYSANTVVIGSGAAGFNAADSLYSLGTRDIIIVTEGIKMGTSRNTGSDKQTYYKLTLAGGAQDSVLDMAKTFFDGGSRHGDIALIEAALSARCFYKLVDIGVPFPHNRYGEYAGYKTDHDPRQRATSAGPLTSRFMTEKLEEQVRQKGIKIFDGYLVIGILTDGNETEPSAVGLAALNINDLDSPGMGLTLFNCTNIIFAAGGPAGMYLTSVYPESQTGSMGIAFEAGVKGINLTESQFGIASTKFRWNLSGTYQQVLPRYVSTNNDGSDEREFLDEYFSSTGSMMDAVFLKGYQWPFDPRKICGSSLVDILVHNETQIKGRRVFLDFMHNPACSCKNGEMDFSLLGKEAYEYLEKSGALFGTPIQRLLKMNKPAVDLYKNNGTDITCEYLEIAVCAQHNNGGLAGNIWWESNIRHFFPVGEANGSFGVYRPGGSALNSTQVGGLRAAQYINANYSGQPQDLNSFADKVSGQVKQKLDIAYDLLKKPVNINNIGEVLYNIRKRMTKAGGHIRNATDVKQVQAECLEDIKRFTGGLLSLSGPKDLPDAFRIRDMLITQYTYLGAIKEYMEKGGRSRGSYLVTDAGGQLPSPGLPGEFKYSLDSGELAGQVCEVLYKPADCGYALCFDWKPVRPVPEEDSWFENIWNEYMKGDTIK